MALYHSKKRHNNYYMNIKIIRRRIKNTIFILGLFATIAKGSQYIPSFHGLIHKESKVTKIPKLTREYEHDGLKNFFPQDNYNRPEQILYRKNYVVSYNQDTKCPNWVLWKLTRNHVDGQIKRPDYAFHEDIEVPEPRAELQDYRGSGYDRGHMCPAGDNKWNDKAMYESFLLSNICPQNTKLNCGLWNQIETSCRNWAKKYNELYIICGPIYFGDTYNTIGKGRVVVPDAFFKAVICLKGMPKGIAFACMNCNADKKMKYYVRTIAEVEHLTGYRLFPNLDEKISSQVKDCADLKEWK